MGELFLILFLLGAAHIAYDPFDITPDKDMPSSLFQGNL